MLESFSLSPHLPTFTYNKKIFKYAVRWEATSETSSGTTEWSGSAGAEGKFSLTLGCFLGGWSNLLLIPKNYSLLLPPAHTKGAADWRGQLKEVKYFLSRKTGDWSAVLILLLVLMHQQLLHGLRTKNIHCAHASIFVQASVAQHGRIWWHYNPSLLLSVCRNNGTPRLGRATLLSSYKT